MSHINSTHTLSPNEWDKRAYNALLAKVIRQIEQGKATEAIGMLIDSLHDSRADIRELAVRMLGNICCGKIALNRVLPNSPYSEAEAEVELQNIRSKVNELSDKKVFTAVAATLNDEDLLVRKSAVYVLTDLDPLRALPLLFSSLSDDNAAVRKSALDIIYSNTFEDSGSDELFRIEDLLPAFEIFVRLLDDEAGDVSAKAASILDKLGNLGQSSHNQI